MGLYVKYLQQIAKQREERGESPPPDCAPQSYWDERRRLEETAGQGLDAPKIAATKLPRACVMR
jgi:hypothetical protein